MSSNLDKDFTIIILAGGYSRRFGNKIKALQYFEGQSLLSRRLWSLRDIQSEVIVSVSSNVIRDECLSNLQDNGLDQPKFSFQVDVIEDQGPMKALLNIIPKLNTKFGLVIGIDNLMINLNDMSQLARVIRSSPKSDLVTVSINMERIIASFLVFDVYHMKKIFLNISQSSEFDRLTDMIRIVTYLTILNVANEGQFINVNTPKQLNDLDPSIIDISPLDKIHRLEPKHHSRVETNCQSFKNELLSWAIPNIIPHIKKNILKDAKKLLAELYEECDLE